MWMRIWSHWKWIKSMKLLFCFAPSSLKEFLLGLTMIIQKGNNERRVFFTGSKLLAAYQYILFFTSMEVVALSSTPKHWVVLYLKPDSVKNAVTMMSFSEGFQEKKYFTFVGKTV